MTKGITHQKIYRVIADLLERSPLVREDLLSSCTKRLGLSPEELADTSAGSKGNIIRSRVGTVINEMHAAKLIGLDSAGRYYLITARPVIIRVERCEREILRALTERSMTRTELREKLKLIFGTDKTATLRDDDMLSTYIGQILKRLCSIGALSLVEGIYSISPRLSARADDLNAIFALKSDFIARLHARGGEFFENYFMSLLERYVKKDGKQVLECFVTGGSADGGIDGIMKTRDSLGFIETIMVQTKNRIEPASETEVRGFYGAVCAKRGTRAIFATTSDFHESARDFLNSLDDYVGVNGEAVFKMAASCSYGIKKRGEKLEIDSKVI